MSARLRYAVSMIFVYAMLWAILSGGDGDSLLIGIPTILLATLVSASLYTPSKIRWRLIGFFRFLPYFVWHSLTGGFAVARLAFRKSLDFTPAVKHFHTRLPDRSSQVFLTSVASLLPGTLITGIQDEQLLVHVIDDSMDVHEDLEKLENRIADLFGIHLSPKVKHDG